MQDHWNSDRRQDAVEAISTLSALPSSRWRQWVKPVHDCPHAIGVPRDLRGIKLVQVDDTHALELYPVEKATAIAH